MYLFFCLFDLKKNEILFYNICAIYNDQTAEFSPPNRGLLRESYPTGLNSGYIRIYKKMPSIEVFIAFGRWKLLFTWLLQVHFGHQDQGGLPPLSGQPMKSWSQLHGEPPRSSGPPWAMDKKGPPGLFRVEIRDYIYYPLIVGDYFIDHERRISSLNNQDSTCI